MVCVGREVGAGEAQENVTWSQAGGWSELAGGWSGLARRSVLMKRGAGEAQENVGERVRVRCRCFGNFACFGGIVQRLVLGARC